VRIADDADRAGVTHAANFVLSNSLCDLLGKLGRLQVNVLFDLRPRRIGVERSDADDRDRNHEQCGEDLDDREAARETACIRARAARLLNRPAFCGGNSRWTRTVTHAVPSRDAASLP